MAGFFLFKTKNSFLDIKNVLLSFNEKGLKEPQKFVLGEFSLYLYSKLTDKNACVVNNTYGFCTAVGSYVYKGLNYNVSLEKTLEDVYNNCLSYKKMYGQYTLILYVKSVLYIVSDALSAKHIFSDKRYSFYTSSFFAATSAISNYTINDLAVFEKLLTGIIVSPDTLVNEIVQINKNEQIKINKSKESVKFLVHPAIGTLPFHRYGKKASIEAQSKKIRSYFSLLKKAVFEDKVDLGLSAGHDSSLLFAAMADEYKDKIHIHTHSTGHVHDCEKRAAQKMAHVKGIDITIIPTPRLDESEIDLDQLLKDNLLFFDGRTSHDIGGFSATYCADYRRDASGSCKTTISGVGGECLRNHYSVRGNLLNADSFFKYHVFNKSFIQATTKEIYNKTREYHLKKAEAVLNISLHGWVKRFNLRRYYSEVLMVDGQGNVIDAYNIVSRCFAPFLDPYILKEAYRGLPYLGNCGEYESAIINQLDPNIGECVNSNNGYPFNNIPFKLRLKEAIRVIVSPRIWEKMNELKKRKIDSNSETYLETVLSLNEELSLSFNDLKRQFPQIDFETAIRGYAMDANIEYLALTMRKLNDK